MKKLLQEIANRLDSIYRADMHAAERQISELLIANGYGQWANKHGQLEFASTDGIKNKLTVASAKGE